MHIITATKLRHFWQKHTNAEISLKIWKRHAQKGWLSFIDVQKDYPSARASGRFTIFKIKGNNYRLIVRIEYKIKRIYIRHILTHEEYNQKKWKRDVWHN